MPAFYDLSGRPIETGFAGAERKEKKNPDHGGNSLMERSSRRTVADPWFLIPIALVSFTALAYPIYVIRPFRHQGPRELAAALEVIQIRPPIELVCAICALLGLFWYWRVQPLDSRRRLAAAGAFLVCTFAVLSRVNIFEMMFHPDTHPLFVPIEQAKVDPDDMVMAVKLGGMAHAYPIRSMGYHHIINDVVGLEPIVATY